MKILLLLVALCVALSGCGGCNDDTSGNNDNSEPLACSDLDGDGYSAGSDCEGPVDCDDGDAEINPAVDEVCGDGIDNDCDADADEGCLVEGPCTDGASRECGADVGRCTIGSQTCEDGEWTDCDGEGPVSETCNGVDDDCDGETDENGIELCDDGLVCNGVSVCEEGACTEPQMLDCSDLDDPCNEGLCSEKDRGCRAFPLENGTACDDGLFCTENGSCNAGECVTTPRDCSAEEDACNLGVCDETADACVKQPKSDGIVCDDGAYCTTGDSCTAGVCAGAARDCSSAADQCNEGVCDDTVDACVPSPLTDGTSCEDGQYCTVSDTCVAGTCTGGGARACGAVGGSCRDGTCDETLDACTGDPVPDGTTCDDGAFCTTADSCVAGTCMGGGPRDCSSVSGVCRIGTCNESINQCVPAPAPDGTTCNDGEFCTVNDSCTAGSCGGGSRNCASAGGECATGVCDESADACVGQPASDGSPCPDALFCTQNEICLSGTCNRAPRDCGSVGDVCNDGVCDDNADACVAIAKADGTTCTDGLFCTSNDSCQAGTCTGGPTSCSQLDDVCTVGTCDEDMNSCMAAALPDNTSCDDGQFCTITDSCSGGVCTGAQRNCAAQSDQCNIGVCDEAADACVPDPTPLEGMSCDDGQFCSNPDTCTSGVCSGPDCSCAALDDDCILGVCNETSNACEPQNRADGTLCTLPDYCLVNTECLGGTCVGDTRDCSAATGGDPCLDPVCDSTQMMCLAVDNGTCNTCDTSRPTADAGPDQPATEPNDLVTLDGSGSTDPMAQALTYSWRIDQRPLGSTSMLSSTTSATPTLLADVSGDFVVCLRVTDLDNCVSAEDCMTITVAPLVDLHIELVWLSDASDLDLHYQAPNYAFSRWFGGLGVVWWSVPNPDWGGGATGDTGDGDPTNDPVLDVDNVEGFGPENINQSNLFDGDPFTIGVHYYLNSDQALGPVTGKVDARIRVYEGGTLVFEDTRNIGCREFWEVAEVQVAGNGTSVAVTPKDTVTLVSNGICHCASNNDCPGAETCQTVNVGGPPGPPAYIDACAP